MGPTVSAGQRTASQNMGRALSPVSLPSVPKNEKERGRKSALFFKYFAVEAAGASALQA
jgi:hypothetical protein